MLVRLTTTVLSFVIVCWFVTTFVSVFTVGTRRVSVSVVVFPFTWTTLRFTTGTKRTTFRVRYRMPPGVVTYRVSTSVW